jgi:polysaccharide biosynthesis protein PslH
MKILFLTSRFPYPPYRGDKLKIYNLMKRLAARGHTLVLRSFIASREEEKYIEDVREFCGDVETVYLPESASIIECAKSVFSTTPFQIAYFRDRRMNALIDKTVRQQSFDLAHIHLIRMAPYGMRIRQIPRILDLTDAGSLYLQRFMAVTKSPVKKIFLPEELRRLVQYEGILSKFEKALVCSEIDQSVLAQRAPGADIGLLFNGIDLDKFSNPGTITPDPYKIIYTGNMSYFPNTDGIVYFVTEIFPLILQQVPQARLTIVGQNPPAKVLRMHGGSISVTGFVPNIRDEYLKSSVSVAPIRFGSGTLNKILEPLALGLPVVSTTLAAAGLPLRHDENILLGDTPADFARSVVRLMNEPALRAKLAMNGAETIRRLYSWETIVDSLEEIYRSVQKRHCGD